MTTPSEPGTMHPLIRAVETLRQRMGVSCEAIATLCDVSRVSYHGWRNGRNMRRSSRDQVAFAIRILLDVVRENAWPQPEHMAMTMAERDERIIELYRAAVTSDD